MLVQHGERLLELVRIQPREAVEDALLLALGLRVGG